MFRCYYGFIYHEVCCLKEKEGAACLGKVVEHEVVQGHSGNSSITSNWLPGALVSTLMRLLTNSCHAFGAELFMLSSSSFTLGVFPLTKEKRKMFRPLTVELTLGLGTLDMAERSLLEMQELV